MMRSPSVGAPLHQRRARVDHHAMRENRHGQPLDVVGDGVIAAFHQRQRLRRAVQRLRAARADAQRQRFVRARLLHDGEHVIHQRFIHGRRAAPASCKLQHVLGRQATPAPRAGPRFGEVAHDLALAGGVRIADAQPHQEAVELRFGQRVGAVVLHRILRGDHHERRAAAGASGRRW